jgi:hypothetical protein
MPAIPPADDAEAPAGKCDKELLLWYKFAEKYLYPKEDSVVALAGRLKTWQAVESQDSNLVEDLLPLRDKAAIKDLVLVLLPIYEDVAQKMKDQVIQACLNLDHFFLRRLSDAAALAAKGEVAHSLDTTGAAVYAFRLLREELGHRPNQNQVRERVERWRKEGGFKKPKISNRQWERTRKDLEQLFREG